MGETVLTYFYSGMVLLYMFIVACTMITAAVIAVAEIRRWWRRRGG